MVKECQPSPATRSYKRQQQFFQQRYPGADLHIQRGTEVEVLPKISDKQRINQPRGERSPRPANPKEGKIARVVIRARPP